MTQSLTTILYVDDEPDIRAIVQMVLELTPGIRVRTASSGEEAIADARSIRPDLTLLDVMMPGLDGPSTFARMRADAELAPMPVIFMTAKAMPEETERLRQMGAIGVIAKPFDPMQLSNQVRALWDARERVTDPTPRAHPGSVSDPPAPRALPESEALHRVQGQRASLALKFLARTRGEVATLSALIAQWQSGDRSALGEIEHLAHRIRGTGATLGFDAVSECAGALENAVKQPPRIGTAAPDTQQLQELAVHLARELDAAAARS